MKDLLSASHGIHLSEFGQFRVSETNSWLRANGFCHKKNISKELFPEKKEKNEETEAERFEASQDPKTTAKIPQAQKIAEGYGSPFLWVFQRGCSDQEKAVVLLEARSGKVEPIRDMKRQVKSKTKRKKEKVKGEREGKRERGKNLKNLGEIAQVLWLGFRVGEKRSLFCLKRALEKIEKAKAKGQSWWNKSIFDGLTPIIARRCHFKEKIESLGHSGQKLLS